MALFDEFKQRGQEAYKQLRQAKAQVQGDKYLSDEGKKQRIAQAQQTPEG